MTPIALLVDDPCPLVHVFRDHWRDVHHKPTTTADGRPLRETIPNEFLGRFCDVMEQRQIKGKFSIVPSPSGKGDVVRGIEGFDPQLTFDWNRTVQERLGPLCDFCPEMITHNLALNLATGGFFSVGESEWSQTQNRTALTPYIEHALRLLKLAGYDCTGVTSPWVFGDQVLREYEASIVEAQLRVYERSHSWYFLHMIFDRPEQRPWIVDLGDPDHAGVSEPTTLVAIPATVRDRWWETIDSPRTDREFVETVADKLISEDEASGDVPRILGAVGMPVLLTHWQSLYSNGLETGLAVLDLVADRINRRLRDQVRWMKCSEIANELLASYR